MHSSRERRLQRSPLAGLGRGWSTRGDLGHLDDEGFLYLADRRAHLILSGGVNIYPQESENVLVTHPDVIDAAVFGIPDDEMGERVHAVVQLRPEVEPSPGEAEALIEHCRAHLARFKCPRTIDFRDELPRLDNGKLYKRLLQAEFWPEPDSA